MRSRDGPLLPIPRPRPQHRKRAMRLHPSFHITPKMCRRQRNLRSQLSPPSVFHCFSPPRRERQWPSLPPFRRTESYARTLCSIGSYLISPAPTAALHVHVNDDVEGATPASRRKLFSILSCLKYSETLVGISRRQCMPPSVQ